MTPSNGKFSAWLPIAVFGLLWADLIRELGKQWEAREQYAYGWFVPFLALGLLWRRWATRPGAGQVTVPGWMRVFVSVVALSFLPIRIVHEINADWPLCGWLLALVVVVLSLYGFFLAGGWAWVRHFWFPVTFILVAVTWPYRIEHGLTHGLMHTVAGLTVQLLGWFNVPAVQYGNLIKINTGFVSIDSACSGIRSLQSTLMSALFLGELYQLRWLRRVLLVAGGVAAAFFFNVVRTLILTWHAASFGLAAVDKWHDTAGLAIFFACFGCLWAMAASLRTTREQRISSLGFPPAKLQVPSFMPKGYLVSVGCWVICVVGVNEVWYQAHECKNAGEFHWTIRLPTNAPAYREIVLPPRVCRGIGSDIGRAGEWTDAAGRQWRAYFFRWNPASIQAVLRARMHRPDECLPAAGLRQTADGGLGYFQAGRLQIPFRQYTYDSEGGALQVFFCQWEDGDEKQGGMWKSNLADRIRSVFVGRRKVGQQTLEVIVAGSKTLHEAAQGLQSEIPTLITMENAPAHGALRPATSGL